eukprot:TRINITY_DN52410_c0_g1_i1.p1 TRINITY_DN52410_c0_g1~~TRINITY_DN52410_c0_g1_i1.p1  ORF type:complete len:275 (-),score=65.24 TRINITY_DN52410_c0_g1_i1:52-876(-)
MCIRDSIHTAHSSTLAVCFSQAHPFDQNEFRLVPQNDAQRERRLEALALRQQHEEHVSRVTGQVWLMDLARVAWSQPLANLYCGESCPVEALACMGDSCLVLGDSAGQIRCWDAPSQVGQAWSGSEEIQLRGLDGRMASVVCVEPLVRRGTVALSVSPSEVLDPVGGALRVPLGEHGGVLILDLLQRAVLTVLDGHQDVVRCLCATPGARLLTAGGKHDAAVLVWDEEQWLRGTEGAAIGEACACLLYTSDAADEEDSVDLGGRRIIKKKKKGR